MAIINDLELLESGGATNGNETRLPGVKDWQLLYPEAIRVEDSTGTNNSSGLQSKSGGQHLYADSVTTPIDHDHVVPFTSQCSVSKDLNQAEQASRNESDDICGPLEVNQSMVEDKSARDGPAIQTMERDRAYDPNRIPSSVFARSDSAAQADWSAVSNESLFSLHGGISFGIDEAVLSAVESRKLREMQSIASGDKIEEVTCDTASASAEERKVEDKSKEEACEEAEAKGSGAVGRSSFSDGSEGSIFSFAFPM